MKINFLIAPIFVVFSGIFSMAEATNPENGTYSYRGRAYEISSGRFIYTENHTEHWRNGRHIYSDVIYRRPDGSILAEKRITFERSRTAPDFRLVDRRDGYTEGAEFTAGNYRLFARRTSQSEMKSKTISITNPVVIDGGFDYFVRENFSRLESGHSINVNFGVSIELMAINFLVQPRGRTTHNGRPALQLRMVINNVVYRAFVEPLHLLYDLETKRLLVYEGLSNINNDEGSGYKARIVFDYP